MNLYDAGNDFECGYESVYGASGENKRLIDWLVSYRMYDTAPRRTGFTPHRELNLTEEKILTGDLLFLKKMQGNVIMEGDPDYPAVVKEFLGDKSPEMLFYMGEISLLEHQSIMVCGARNASDIGLDIAKKCGKYLIEQDYVVASGYARGVDKAAHFGALEAGGTTIAVLPYGLASFRISNALEGTFDPERFCVLSEVPPTHGFTAQSAFRRNKFLAALSEAVIVIEPGESGGTWYSAKRAARMKKPLFYFEGSRPDVIGEMVPLGGIRLEMKDGYPDLSPVFEQCVRS